MGTLLGLALDDLPAGLGVQAVHAWYSLDNDASLRLAAKVGMVRDPEARSYLQTGSRWAMHDCYTRRASAPS